MLSVHSFWGNIGTIVPAAAWQFAGGNDALTTFNGQRITASATMSLGAATTAAVNVAMCSAPLSGTPAPFNGVFDTVSISTRSVVAVTGSIVPPSTGFYTIGPCVRDTGANSLDNNGGPSDGDGNI